MQYTLDRREWLKHVAAGSVLAGLPAGLVAATETSSPDGVIRLDMSENPYGVFPSSVAAIGEAASGSNRCPREHFLDKDWLRVSMGTPDDMQRLSLALAELSSR